CAAPRAAGAGTWITPDMAAAYRRLHALGAAHSIETWHDGELVGGLYGIEVGKVFCGESMFSRRADASKVAFVELAQQCRQRGIDLVDCQLASPHLRNLGSRAIPRSEFIRLLGR
ncbi:MAG TPA: leucyl/phenylalanyl-tRNA--protein transferase, partial [Steroidobacteraceae bacterium]|nr:leucyl/phenylalanyl-tRNA--protein transferase [Steroidobacteraceae bacterium]